jgi:mannose-6-phosphate isomerase-like protein (cupin superfamily)
LPGASIEFKRPPDTDPTVAVMAAGPDFPGPLPHIHRTHHEIFYVVDGRFDFLVGNEARRVQAGTLLDVPPGVVHDFRNPGPGVAHLLGLAWPGGLQAYFEAVEDMLLGGTFTLEKLEALRLRYDTEEVHIDWSVREDR